MEKPSKVRPAGHKKTFKTGAGLSEKDLQKWLLLVIKRLPKERRIASENGSGRNFTMLVTYYVGKQKTFPHKLNRIFVCS